MADNKELSYYQVDPNAPKLDESHPWLDAARTVFDSLGGGSPDVGLSPIAGLSLKNPKNIELLLKLMTKDSGGAYSAEAKKAFGFMKAKYPKLFSIPTGGIDETNISTNMGSYNPAQKRIMIRNDYPEFMFPGTPKNTTRTKIPAESLVDTLGHELTHALQQKRGLWTAMEDYKAAGPYHQNPFEDSANQAGSTAKNAYLRFLDEVSKLPPK